MRKILLGNAEMGYRGGTQAWVRQLYDTLGESCEVSVATASGEVPDGLRAFREDRQYDLALMNHWPTAKALRRARIDKRIVTCHGILPYEEVPVIGADAYVAVSECVQRWMPFRSTIIRNPIDVGHFQTARKVNSTLRRVAFVSNRQGRALETITSACRLLGVDLRVVGGCTGVDDTQPIYEWADLVIGIARVAMEALACSRNVLCFDYVGNHGMVTAESIDQLKTSNYGGHQPGVWPSSHELADRIAAAYDPSRDLRDAVVAAHHPRVIAGSYLELAEGTRASWTGRAVRSGPPQLMSPKLTIAAQRLLGRIRAVNFT